MLEGVTDFLSDIDYKRAGTFIAGNGLGAIGSLGIGALETLFISAIDNLLGGDRITPVVGYGSMAIFDGITAFWATDIGLDDTNTLSKGVKLGFGSVQMLRAFGDVLAMTINSGLLGEVNADIAENAANWLKDYAGSVRVSGIARERFEDNIMLEKIL